MLDVARTNYDVNEERGLLKSYLTIAMAGFKGDGVVNAQPCLPHGGFAANLV